MDPVILGLLVILLLVLALPFVFRAIEENLEPFLFVMGLAAVLLSGLMTKELVITALEEPIKITVAVLVAGLVFSYLQKQLQAGIASLLRHIPLSVFLFLVVVVLGLASSVITAIIAALVLVEVVQTLPLKHQQKVAVDIIACFAIGLGAALTPIGEPLSTIATSKLGVDFFYLLRLLGPYIIPGVIALGIFAAIYVGRSQRSTGDEPEEPLAIEGVKDVITRALKVYLFVMALVFLGEGFKPLIETYVLGLDNKLLYWINTISAVLDNATLTAAEIDPKMTSMQVKSILMGLLISGGMLIPGNIPNIISAGKLKIKSQEWARLGLPLGLVLLVIYFVIVELL